MPRTDEERRAYQRNYKRKNRERYHRYEKEWREENPDYYKRWYEDNKEWANLVTKLRYICRPDLVSREYYERYYPGLDASDIEFKEDIAEECEKVYQLMLRKLRIKFGRDPDTGYKIDRVHGNSKEVQSEYID